MNLFPVWWLFNEKLQKNKNFKIVDINDCEAKPYNHKELNYKCGLMNI